jgi:2-polyprenyl-6-methoxyphenol hydroxylase-like FAD-dependent oxidoreductase
MAKIRAFIPPPSYPLLQSPVGLDQALKGLDSPRPDHHVALVTGAGPTGLAIANQLRRDGFDEVVVVDTRDVLDRLNCVGIKEESIDHAAQLGALQPLLDSRADRLHGIELYDRVRDSGFSKESPPLQPKAPVPFDPINSLTGPSLILSPINEIQHAHNVAAVEAGVVVAAKASLSMKRGPGGFFQAKVKQGNRSWTVARPDLVVVAEGANSPTRDSLGVKMKEPGVGGIIETWAIGNVFYPAEKSFAGLTLFNAQPLGFSNCLVNAKTGQINVSVSLPVGTNPTPEETGPIIQARAAEMLNLHNEAHGVERRYAPDELPLSWVLEKVVHVTQGKADQMTVGENVVLAGDTATHDSPLAAMGINAGTSTHVAAASKLGKAILARKNRPQAMAQYAQTLNQSGDLWHTFAETMNERLTGEAR